MQRGIGQIGKLRPFTSRNRERRLSVDRGLGLGPNTLDELGRTVPHCGIFVHLSACNYANRGIQADLDSRELLVNRPMALRRADGHAIWISNAALKETLAQLPGERWPEDGDILGGEIIRDHKGNPSGVFVDNAILLVRSPPWTTEQMEGYFERAMADALSVGLTGVHDAFASIEFLEVFQR